MSKSNDECIDRNYRLRKKKEVERLVDILNGRNVFYGTKVMKLNAGIYWKWSNLVLTLFDPEEGPFANITVNVEDLPPDEFAVDENNFPLAKDVLKVNRIAEPTEKWVRSGFCEYPVYKLKKSFLEEEI